MHVYYISYIIPIYYLCYIYKHYMKYCTYIVSSHKWVWEVSLIFPFYWRDLNFEEFKLAIWDYQTILSVSEIQTLHHPPLFTQSCPLASFIFNMQNSVLSSTGGSRDENGDVASASKAPSIALSRYKEFFVQVQWPEFSVQIPGM